MSKIRVVPIVKEYNDKNKSILFNKLKCNEELSEYQKDLLSSYLDNNCDNELLFIVNNELPLEGYKIEVNEKGVTCYYSNFKGKHNAVLTLRQLLMNINELTTCSIYDEPDFSFRSIMMDISRNKVPKVSTLKKVIDELALVKINNLQLYVEGRSFYFESLDRFYEDKNNFLTGEDVTILTKYALDRGIELVPNLNCFGHMAYWLNQEELKDLALCKESFVFPNSNKRNYAQTINPYNETAQKLVFDMFDDMLKYYPNTEKCTIGGDEPFELIFPTKNPMAKEIYEYQLKSVIDYVHKKGKVPYMWADVAREYPEMLETLGEVVLLDWCYEAKWVDENRMKFYEKYKVPFICCPGTSGWSSFSGKMGNMFKNIEAYARLGKKYNSLGIILTDWNDGGSLSQLVSNICCYVYGACYSWNYESVNKEEINEYLDKNIYKNKIAKSVIDLGNYYLMQDEIGYSPSLFHMFYSHGLNGYNYDIKNYSDCAALNNSHEILNAKECEKTKEYLDNWFNELNIEEENDYTRELMFVYRMIRHALNLNIVHLNLRDFRATKEDLNNLLLDLNTIIEDYKDIWFNRNKESEYKLSRYHFILLKKQYINMINMLTEIEEEIA